MFFAALLPADVAQPVQPARLTAAIPPARAKPLAGQLALALQAVIFSFDLFHDLHHDGVRSLSQGFCGTAIFCVPPPWKKKCWFGRRVL